MREDAEEKWPIVNRVITTQEISFYRARCQSVVGVTAAIDALDFLPSTLNHYSNVTQTILL